MQQRRVCLLCFRGFINCPPDGGVIKFYTEFYSSREERARARAFDEGMRETCSSKTLSVSCVWRPEAISTCILFSVKFTPHLISPVSLTYVRVVCFHFYFVYSNEFRVENNIVNYNLHYKVKIAILNNFYIFCVLSDELINFSF